MKRVPSPTVLPLIEDPDSGSLAGGESSSSSSSECTKDNSRSPSAEPRVKKGLSRRQRKNRRRETPEKKKKKILEMKPAVTQTAPLRQFLKFPASLDVFERLVRAYLLSPDEMLLNGYPTETANHRGCVMIYGRAPMWKKKNPGFDVNAREFVPKSESGDSGQGSSGEEAEAPERFERICARCGEVFYTTGSEYVTRETCRYHWGRLRPQGEYSCCGGTGGVPGCETARLHVWSGVAPGANGPFGDFTRTRRGGCGVFALDCEMCFTVRGLECTKVTLVDARGVVLYDRYVRPERAVVDFNTRFSGVTAAHLTGAVPLRRAQTELLALIGADAVLVGHGLENDLRALRIVHPTVVDTALAFRHGAPFRRSLKSLAAGVLQRAIQEGERGHDSYEDACTCMELMLWRVRKNFRDYLEGGL